MPLEAAKCLSAALALGLLSLEKLARGWMHPALGDRDPVKGAVELAVAAAVEPVALSIARAQLLDERTAASTSTRVHRR